MSTTRTHVTPLQRTAIGGRSAIVLFVFSLLSFVVESQVTQYVQTTLGYRQPFFIFYLVHSSFSLIFPLHLLCLFLTTRYSTVSLFKGLAFAITKHLSPTHIITNTKNGIPFYRFPIARFFGLTLALTVGITCPSLLWFCAVSLASMTDVTAIWNTNAFFAYFISRILIKQKLTSASTAAVILATLGTLGVIYGGSNKSVVVNKNPEVEMSPAARTISFKPSSPLLGILLTLLASFLYGLYQVLYKIYAALPSNPEPASDRLYEQIPEDEDRTVNECSSIDVVPADDAVYPPPFGLYPNLLTSVMGFFTCTILWIPIPFLHWSGAEPFRAPPNGTTIFAISCIALSGAIFNAGFMVLLGLWGPIIVSIGNLLTIVLIMISDALFGAGLEVVTLMSLAGTFSILLAFSVLSYHMFEKSP